MEASTGIAAFLGVSMEAFERLRSSLVDPRLSVSHAAVRQEVIALDLSLQQVRSSVESSHFVFFRKRTSGRSEFTLSIQARIEAALADDQRQGLPIRISFGLPAFVPLPGGGGRHELIFVSSTGRDYVVHFLDGGAASVDVLSTAGHESLEFVPGTRLNAAQWPVISDLVETLAGWTRDKAPVDVAENWMLPQDDSEFAKALGEVVAEARLVITNLALGSSRASMIGAFSARLEMYFDQMGQPIQKIPPVDLEWQFDKWSRSQPKADAQFNSQQFSLLVSFERTDRATRLLIRPQIPDILVAGEVYARFRSWLQDDESIRPLLKTAANALELAETDIRCSWDTALRENEFAIVRIGQHLSGRHGGDADLIVLDLALAGRAVRMALEARLILPDDDTPIQEHWVRLRALSRDGDWRVLDDDDPSLVATWAARLFRTLLSVQSLRMGDTFVPGEGLK